MFKDIFSEHLTHLFHLPLPALPLYGRFDSPLGVISAGTFDYSNAYISVFTYDESSDVQSK